MICGSPIVRLNAVLCSLGLLLAGQAVSAQGLQLSARPNVLGNANQFGYARIVKNLGHLPGGEGLGFPVDLVFTSDPKLEPGIFGPGWTLPLFDSTAYRSRRSVLVWESPDEYRRFFVGDSEADVKRGETAYLSQQADWRALENERRGSIRIFSVSDPGQYFDYRDGRLYEFSMGSDAPVYALEFGSRDMLRRVFDRSSRESVLEVVYSGAEVQEFVVNGESYRIEMGEGDWTSSDGWTDYADYASSVATRSRSMFTRRGPRTNVRSKKRSRFCR